MTNIEDKFASYPALVTKRLNEVRALIREIAARDPAIGKIEESLKWGQISLSTVRPKSGTPIRIDADALAGTYSIYVPCSTSLIEDFRDVHPGMFRYCGTREIRLDMSKPMPEKQLTLFLSAALRYYVK